MANLYLTYLDEDCGSVSATLGNRFHGLYPSYQLYWPIPPSTAPSMRDVILHQIEAVVVCIGPKWERLTDHFAAQGAMQAMHYDLQQIVRMHQPIVGVFYERAAIWPTSLRFLAGNMTLQINQQTDVNRIVISLHLKLQQIYR